MSGSAGSKRPLATKAIDQAWRQDASVSKRACKRESKSAYDQTTRAVFDNLRDEPRELVDLIQVNGLTMRETILRGQRKARRR